MASFVEFCALHNLSQPPDKIVKNLCTFLCQDAEQTPTFAFTRKLVNGILSFQGPAASDAMKNGREAHKDKDSSNSPEDPSKARLARRGASLAFNELSTKFGAQLLHVIPNMWQSMAGGILSAFQPGKWMHILIFYFFIY